ncbi:MAG: DUF1934 domain-containing protein [Lachnospiraceae bacterium]|nr:DUF1934 domain-containing protein [Lachnospiraceae bacterium]
MEENKKIPVKIKISGKHTNIDDQNPTLDSSIIDISNKTTGTVDETIEEAFGVYSCQGTSMYLVYETKEAESITIHNMIKMSIDPAEVKKTSTLRKGSITTPASNLSYILDETGSGFYTTPYGRLDVKTFTKEMVIFKNDTSITCYLKGRLEMNNSPVSEFNLKIEAVAI